MRVDVVPAAGDLVDAGRGGALRDSVRVSALAGEDEAALAFKVLLGDETGDEVAQAADLPPFEAGMESARGALTMNRSLRLTAHCRGTTTIDDCRCFRG